MLRAQANFLQSRALAAGWSRAPQLGCAGSGSLRGGLTSVWMGGTHLCPTSGTQCEPTGLNGTRSPVVAWTPDVSHLHVGQPREVWTRISVKTMGKCSLIRRDGDISRHFKNAKCHLKAAAQLWPRGSPISSCSSWLVCPAGRAVQVELSRCRNGAIGAGRNCHE